MNTTPTDVERLDAVPGRAIHLRQRKILQVGSSPYLQPIMPLSYDWTALKTLIDALEPTGNTNQGIGLAWALA